MRSLSKEFLDAIMKFFWRFLACVCALVAIYCGYDLLMVGKFSGAEFISIIAVSIAFVFMVIFLSEIQELSIGGAVLKLRDIKKDLDASVKNLERDRVSMFKVFVKLSMRFPGGLGSSRPFDERFELFFLLFERIQTSGCLNEVRGDVVNALILIRSNHIRKLSQYLGVDFDSSFDYFDIVSAALDPKVVADVVGRNKSSEDEVRSNIKGSLEVIEKMNSIDVLLKGNN
jgi:hypothetical protein